MEIKGVQGTPQPIQRSLPLAKFKDTGFSHSLKGVECQPIRYRKSLLERMKDLFKSTPDTPDMR